MCLLWLTSTHMCCKHFLELPPSVHTHNCTLRSVCVPLDRLHIKLLPQRDAHSWSSSPFFSPCSPGVCRSPRGGGDDPGRSLCLQRALWLRHPEHHPAHPEPHPRHAPAPPHSAAGGNVLPPPQDGRLLSHLLQAQRSHSVPGHVSGRVQRLQPEEAGGADSAGCPVDSQTSGGLLFFRTYSSREGWKMFSASRSLHSYWPWLVCVDLEPKQRGSHSELNCCHGPITTSEDSLSIGTWIILAHCGRDVWYLKKSHIILSSLYCNLYLNCSGNLCFVMPLRTLISHPARSRFCPLRTSLPNMWNTQQSTSFYREPNSFCDRLPTLG